MIFQQYNIKVIKIKSYYLQLFCIVKVIERKITKQGKLAQAFVQYLLSIT